LLLESAEAARIAVIDTAKAPIYETIGKDLKVKTYLKRGTEVRSSSLPTNGFYKIEWEGQYGWVRADHILLKEGIIQPPQVVEAELPMNQDTPFIGATEVERDRGRPVTGDSNIVKSRDRGVRKLWRR
jgi:uncharacterized protein YgiM (DUF1202 family)